MASKKPRRYHAGLVRLEQIPNIGPSIAADLRRIGIHQAADLQGRQAWELYERLCEVDCCRHDPCVLDVFLSAVDFVQGSPARPWWKYTPQRKREVAARQRAAANRPSGRG